MKFTRRQFGIGFGTLASYAMTDSRFGLGEPASIGEGGVLFLPMLPTPSAAGGSHWRARPRVNGTLCAVSLFRCPGRCCGIELLFHAPKLVQQSFEISLTFQLEHI